MEPKYVIGQWVQYGLVVGIYEKIESSLASEPLQKYIYIIRARNGYLHLASEDKLISIQT